MLGIDRIFRLFYIFYVLAKYNLDALIFGEHQFYPVRLLVYLNPWYWFRNKALTRGDRLCLALESLGPIFVKAGQIISTRRDLVPPDIADALSKLQDKVSSFSGETAQKIIENALRAKLSDLFLEVNTAPLAAASIAQVHAARLKCGKEVIIKVLRPNVHQLIKRDIALLRSLINLALFFIWDLKRFKPLLILNEIEQTLHDELDLMKEGANAALLRRNFTNHPSFYVPEIYWPYCHKQVLVQERIYGIPIYQINTLRELKFDLTKVALCCINVFFTQVFRDSYFHADLHPGNLFIDANSAAAPKLIAVDFGIVGSLNAKDQRYIAENMLAFFHRDYQRVAELHLSSGWVSPDTRIDQFESAIRAVSEPILGKVLKDISFGELLLNLFQVARRFRINIQPQLILLQKTLLSIEALSRELAPELDLWAAARPHLEQWLKEQVGWRGFVKRIRHNLPRWSEELPGLPSLFHEALTEFKLKQELERFKYSQQKNDSHSSIAMKFFIAGASFTALITLFIFLTFKL